MNSQLEFCGWWDRDKEIEDCPDPWENFTIQIHGSEVGDFEDNPETIHRIVEDAGYELILRRVKVEPSEIEDALYTALAFAKSCILSGEQWSEACDQMIDGALRKARGE